MEDILLLGALNELAEALGDSNSHPLSSSLLCLRCGITFDQKGKIMVAFNQVLRNVPFDSLEVANFRKALQEIVPEAKDYAESLIIAFIKAFARNHIAELVPFARTLD